MANWSARNSELAMYTHQHDPSTQAISVVVVTILYHAAGLGISVPGV